MSCRSGGLVDLHSFPTRRSSDLENVTDRFVVGLHAQHVGLEAAAFAFGATDIEIAQELHLDFLEPGAATALATAAAGVRSEEHTSELPVTWPSRMPSSA